MSYLAQQRQLIDRLRATRGHGVRRSTIPIRSAHSETARTLTAVAFPPLELTREIETALIAPLRTVQEGHHYYPAGALHVTIKNVRVIADPPNFDRSTVESAARVLGRVVPRHGPVTFRLSQVIAMDTSVAVFATTTEAFRDLVLELDRELRASGIPDDKRYASPDVFFGNLTICRFATPASPRFLAAVAALEHRIDLPFEVRRVDLMSFDGLCREASRTRWASCWPPATRPNIESGHG